MVQIKLSSVLLLLNFFEKRWCLVALGTGGGPGKPDYPEKIPTGLPHGGRVGGGGGGSAPATQAQLRTQGSYPFLNKKFKDFQGLYSIQKEP